MEQENAIKDSLLLSNSRLTAPSTAYNLYDRLENVASTPEIRLITIEPSSDASALVRCSLRKTALSPDCQYSALSYVWSDPPGKSIVVLNGVEFEVTKNLGLALQRVRDNTREIVLWVDALCINQTDTAERSSQVTIMDKIFKNAQNVFCWIGEAENGSDWAIAALDTSELERSEELTVDQGHDIDKRFWEESLEERSCAALEHFGTRPYWGRTWIMQEFLLAPELVLLYGSVSVSWQALHSLSLFYTMLLTNPALRQQSLDDSTKSEALEKFSNGIHTFVFTRNKYRGSSWSNSLSSLVGGLRSLEATDKRDKIYGFYGLAADGDRFITVDYSKPVSYVFTNFARTHIERTGSLNIIFDAGLRGSNNGQALNLPSWVPDWSEQEFLGPSLREMHYSAAKQTRHDIQSSGHGNTLCVRGIPCGKIAMFKQDLSWWGLEDLLFSKGPNEYPSGTPRLQALFRTLTADRYWLSDKRLDDDPNLWFYSLAFGFFLDLGIQTNYRSSYALAAMSGLGIAAAKSPNLSQLVNQEHPTLSLQHDFIVAFRDWAESCIKVLDDIIRRKRVPTTREDGAIMSKTLWKRLNPWLSQNDDPPESAISDVDHLLRWREYLEKTRSCSSGETIMELFIGSDNDTATELPFEALRQTHGVDCWPKYRNTISVVCGSSSIFTTDGGYIGAGPNSIRAGDEVYVLFGCSLPVVLRRLGDQYVFIGKCFVHGLMDGEATEFSDAGKVAVHDLEIV